jgi:hypothetical protein
MAATGNACLWLVDFKVFSSETAMPNTKLRYNYNILNYDLFRFNLKNNPGCVCGFECENVFHFFLECSINEQIHFRTLVEYQICGLSY